MLVSVESTDKIDNSTLPAHCPDEEFRSIEASRCQELHRTIANEPLRTVQQMQGLKVFEAWHAIVRRYGRRNMCEKIQHLHLRSATSLKETEQKTWSSSTTS